MCWTDRKHQAGRSVMISSESDRVSPFCCCCCSLHWLSAAWTCLPLLSVVMAQVRSSGLSTPLLDTFLLLLTPDCVKSPRSKLKEDLTRTLFYSNPNWKIIFFKLPDTQHLAISLLYSGLVKTEISSKTKQWLFPYWSLVWEKRKSVQGINANTTVLIVCSPRMLLSVSNCVSCR